MVPVPETGNSIRVYNPPSPEGKALYKWSRVLLNFRKSKFFLFVVLVSIVKMQLEYVFLIMFLSGSDFTLPKFVIKSAIAIVDGSSFNPPPEISLGFIARKRRHFFLLQGN